MTRLAAALERWFFQKSDSRHAAALRVGFAGLYLFFVWDLFPVREQLFGARGFYGALSPEYIDWTSPRAWLFGLDAPGGFDAFLLGGTVAAASMLVGFRSRVSTFLTFASLFLLHGRNGWILCGGDHFLRMAGFWLLFLDTGRRWSVDAVRKPAHASPVEGWPIRAIQVQVVIIYAFTALGKLGFGTWRDGSALGYSLLGMWGGAPRFPWLAGASPLLKFGTWLTLAVELFIPVALCLPRLRAAGILMALFLHAGIDLFMNIRMFSAAMVLGLAAFAAPAKTRSVPRP